MKRSKLWQLLVITLLVLASCSESDIISEKEINSKSVNTALQGKVSLKLIAKNLPKGEIQDARAVLDNIMLKKVKKGSMETSDDQFVTIYNQVEEFSLVSMEGGIMVDIGIVDIPAGLYDQAICNIREAWVIVDGVRYDCLVPGNTMTLIFQPPVEITQHLSPELDIAIDVQNSFIKAGKSYIFKPKVIVENNTVFGRLAGGVIDAINSTEEFPIPVPGAKITTVIGDDVYETFALYDFFIDDWGVLHYPGEYQLGGLPEGTYTVYATAEGYYPSEITIQIVKGNFTFENFYMVPIQ